MAAFRCCKSSTARSFPGALSEYRRPPTSPESHPTNSLPAEGTQTSPSDENESSESARSVTQNSARSGRPSEKVISERTIEQIRFAAVSYDQRHVLIDGSAVDRFPAISLREHGHSLAHSTLVTIAPRSAPKTIPDARPRSKAVGSGVASLPQPREVVPCPDHRWAVGVLDLDPVPGWAGAIWRVAHIRLNATIAIPQPRADKRTNIQLGMTSMAPSRKQRHPQ
jgi:hypothetical protein